MGRLRRAEAEAIAALELAVLYGTPDEAARLCGNFGTSIFTAHILGIAGHFRGLDMVKALVENGASFRLGPTGKDAVRALFPSVLENELATIDYPDGKSAAACQRGGADCGCGISLRQYAKGLFSSGRFAVFYDSHR